MKKAVLVMVLLMSALVSAAHASSTDSDPSPSAPDNPDFVILSFVTVKDSALVDFKKALFPYAALTRQEPGCIAYVVHQSPDDPHKFVTYEHWKSAEARSEHLAEPYAVQFLGSAPQLYFENGAAPVRMTYEVINP